MRATGAEGRSIAGLCAGAVALLLAGCQAPGSNWGTAAVTEAAPWGAYEAVVDVPKPDAPPRVFQCNGPWSPTTTEVNLIADFGAQSITRAEVQGPGGTMTNGSVLLAGDPKLRAEVAWFDGIGYTIPSRVNFSDETAWKVAGIGIGTSLADVEKANGRPFRLVGFGGDNGGVVTDWQGGRLASMPGPCRLGLQFAISALAPDGAQAKASGPTVYSSNNAAVRALNPTVGSFWVRYKW